ncbi:ribonuclease H-like domain-containing protein [Roridomyces roridus]|uniref:Ribonuclease H-like domain-containing protein n=1 Tax=Roridomyces roridus TaxID=1738132 RepID=A0AAD7CD44_9AGAR|nr:ribonuclease H-like domain-containing protein [Roridomyces roridus]
MTTHFPPFQPAEFKLVTSAEEADFRLSVIGRGAVIGLDIESRLSKEPSKTDSKKKARLAHAAALESGTFEISWDTMLLRLVQISYKDDPVIVLDLFMMREVPRALRRILTASDIIKVAAGVNCDLTRLWYDLGIETKSAMSLGLMASIAYPEELAAAPSFTCPEAGLSAIVEYLFNRSINKNDAVSDWSGELRQEQLTYAATDARATLVAYDVLRYILRHNGCYFSVDWFSWDYHAGHRVNHNTTEKWDHQCPWWVKEVGYDGTKRV